MFPLLILNFKSLNQNLLLFLLLVLLGLYLRIRSLMSDLINQPISLLLSVPIIPTFLYAMEHPSPEPQTVLPSHAAPQLSAPRTRTPTPGPQSRQNPRLPPLVSLFDNITFNLQEGPDTDLPVLTGPTAEHSNDTGNTTVGGARVGSTSRTFSIAAQLPDDL